MKRRVKAFDVIDPIGNRAEGGANTKPQRSLVCEGIPVIEPSGWITSHARTGLKLLNRRGERVGCGSPSKQSRAKLVHRERGLDTGLKRDQGWLKSLLSLTWLGRTAPKGGGELGETRSTESKSQQERKKKRKNYKRVSDERSLLNLGAGIKAAGTAEGKPQNHSK